MFSWGRGTSGQLGHGDMANCSSPKPISFFEDYSVTQLSAGWNHSGFVSGSPLYSLEIKHLNLSYLCFFILNI